MGHTLAVPITGSWEGGPLGPLSRTEVYVLDVKTLGFLPFKFSASIIKVQSCLSLVTVHVLSGLDETDHDCGI
jgi:hypothetical protein